MLREQKAACVGRDDADSQCHGVCRAIHPRVSRDSLGDRGSRGHQAEWPLGRRRMVPGSGHLRAEGCWAPCRPAHRHRGPLGSLPTRRP